MAKIKNKWTEKDIRDLFNKLDEKLGVDSSDVPINVNNRLKTTIARYRYYKNRRPYDFEFGRYIMNVEDKKALDDVAIHEYAHWYQASVLKSDSGHNPEFRQIVKSLGSDNYHANCTKFVGDEYRKAKKMIEGDENIIEDNAPKKHNNAPKKHPKKDEELTILMRKYNEILCDERNYSKKDGLLYVIVKGKGNDIEIIGSYKTFKKANEFAVFAHHILGIEDARILTLSK